MLLLPGFAITVNSDKIGLSAYNILSILKLIKDYFVLFNTVQYCFPHKNYCIQN